MNVDAVIRSERDYADQVHNVYANALRFRWNIDRVRGALREIYDQERYQAMPRYAKCFVQGVIWHCDRLHTSIHSP